MSTVFTCAALPAPQHARTLHTLLLRKLLVCWAKESHPSSPFLPSAQWGSQSNLFLMGKHRHEYARTHAHTHTRDSGVRDTQCSLHPKMGRTLGLSLPLAEPPKVPPPPPHTARASQTHPGSLSLTQALGVSHHSHSSRPPTWTPAATASHMLVCAHTRITVTVTHNRLSHTHSIKTVLVSHMDTSTHSEHSPFHTDNTAPPETQSPPRPPAPSALTPLHSAVGNRYTLHAGTSGCLACAWGKTG